jgi:hypothetical protein
MAEELLALPRERERAGWREGEREREREKEGGLLLSWAKAGKDSEERSKATRSNSRAGSVGGRET